MTMEEIKEMKDTGSVFYETYERPIHWEIEDKLIYVDGTEEIRKYHNVVVNGCSTMIAILFANKSGYTGLQYWAVGKGDSTWSNDNPPVPSVTNSKLTSETFRKAITSDCISFIDASNNISATPTNRIQVALTFNENEANGELREFGLYTGNATATLNSGIMINQKIHPVIYKTTGMKLARTIRLTF